MNIDCDSLTIVWNYLEWEDQLVFRQCEDRLLHERILITDDYTCQKNIIDKSRKHWHQDDLSKQVEDVHYYCHHKEIREAARVYNDRSFIDYSTVKLRFGRYKGTLLSQMSNFAYLQALIHHQRENHQYSEIHEYLCSRIETQPECISFGVHKGRRYDQLPIEYRNWLISNNISNVDNAAVVSSFKRARYM
jgi:hypothetical protein